MMKTELYKFLTESPPAEHMRSTFRRISIPTEVVVSEPQYIVPEFARVYSTSSWYVDEEILNYDDLYKRKGFNGTAHHDEVLLVEVWQNWGDDGHIDYRLRGWMYVPNSRFEEELNGHNWLRDGKLPLCMYWGEGYAEEHVTKLEQIYKYENHLPPHNKE